MMTFPIYGKIKNVPNHRPGIENYDLLTTGILLVVDYVAGWNMPELNEVSSFENHQYM